MSDPLPPLPRDDGKAICPTCHGKGTVPSVHTGPRTKVIQITSQSGRDICTYELVDEATDQWKLVSEKFVPWAAPDHPPSSPPVVGEYTLPSGAPADKSLSEIAQEERLKEGGIRK